MKLSVASRRNLHNWLRYLDLASDAHGLTLCTRYRSEIKVYIQVVASATVPEVVDHTDFVRVVVNLALVLSSGKLVSARLCGSSELSEAGETLRALAVEQLLRLSSAAARARDGELFIAADVTSASFERLTSDAVSTRRLPSLLVGHQRPTIADW